MADAHRESSPDTGDDLHFQVLGPMRLWRGDTELDPGPRQQAHLLALLLLSAGQPISREKIVDLTWGDDVPNSATNIIHKYVGALRHLLEPTLPGRGIGSYLRRSGSGYVFTADADRLDLIAFRELTRSARTGRAEDALEAYVEGLRLWRGPAADGLIRSSQAMPIVTGLEGEFLEVCGEAAELAQQLGRPDRMLPALRLATLIAPLHEPTQAAFVSALGDTGRQAEALAAFQAIRVRLADDLGVDPSPALQGAHRRVLDMSLSLGGEVSLCPPEATLVGRSEELEVLRQAVDSAVAGGTGIVLVEGEPGVGKTRLLEEIATETARRGPLIVSCCCLEGDGTPSLWPWIQAVGRVIEGLPEHARERWRTSELIGLLEPRDGLDLTAARLDPEERFRLFERVVAMLGEASAQRPVIVVVDDLQWADIFSLQLFSHFLSRLPSATAVVAALRDHAPRPSQDLSRVLAAAARLPGHRRIRLGPLDVTEVAELIRLETGQKAAPNVVRAIHARTSGNPFLAREVCRLLARSGGINRQAEPPSAIPATVRDVVRARVAGLDHDAQRILQIAALIGRDVDVGLLARAAGVDASECLDRLEPLEALGLLAPVPDDPLVFRFVHDLIRESVVKAIAAPTASRAHLLIADATEHQATAREYAAERLAYHLWAAGPLVDPARVTEALVRAGRPAVSLVDETGAR
jgi:DNA-binding SARP family transcriptional activator